MKNIASELSEDNHLVSWDHLQDELCLRTNYEVRGVVWRGLLMNVNSMSQNSETIMLKLRFDLTSGFNNLNR